MSEAEERTDWKAKWYADGGEKSLRVGYILTDSGVVFDVGAYDGAWTKELLDNNPKAYPLVYLFEPLPNMCFHAERNLEKRRVLIVNAALSDKDGTAVMSDNGHESSMYLPGATTVRTIDVAKFISEAGLTKIDLMSLNAEGEEYAIMERLIDTRLILLFNFVQIQFHDFVAGAVERRDRIREALAETHKETYCYPWVWEGWMRK